MTFIKKLLSSKSKEDSIGATWQQPFALLRQKWHEVPAGECRFTTKEINNLSDEELLEWWTQLRITAITEEGFGVRGWYHMLYKDVFRGKKVMDVGSGLGLDGITFAQHGAHLTFVDVAESNLALLQRLCGLLQLTEVDFCYLENLDSLSTLSNDYNIIWCQGSLITAPYEVIQPEVQELLKHLPVGGRWVELAYPKERWERDGRLSFEQWGERTDGGAPWIEWYDLSKLQNLLAPAQFDVVLNFNFHNNDFNWFDLVRTQ